MREVYEEIAEIGSRRSDGPRHDLEERDEATGHEKIDELDCRYASDSN